MAKGQYIFSCDVTQLEGKQGKLRDVGDGYYEIVVGAFNISNMAGDFYEYTDRVAKLFTHSSWMLSMLRKNQLYGECDHPGVEPYVGKPNWKDLWMDRLREVRTSNIANQYRQFELKPLNKQERGQTVIGVYAHVKPVKEEYKCSLLDPNQNTAHSVRSFINRRTVGFQEYRECKEIITYDWVTLGGVGVATKYETPSLESGFGRSWENIIDGNKVDIPLTPEMINFIERQDMQRKSVGLESGNMIDATMIRDITGWRAVPTIDLDTLSSRSW